MSELSSSCWPSVNVSAVPCRSRRGSDRLGHYSVKMANHLLESNRESLTPQMPNEDFHTLRRHDKDGVYLDASSVAIRSHSYEIRYQSSFFYKCQQAFLLILHMKAFFQDKRDQDSLETQRQVYLQRVSIRV